MHVLNSNQRRCNFSSSRAVRTSWQNYLRQEGRSPTEQIGNLLATLWNVAHDFVNQRFANMEGDSSASVGGRPNAGINLCSALRGLS